MAAVVASVIAIGGCGAPQPNRAPDFDRSLVIGVPEANAVGADVGTGQFVSLVSLEGLTTIGADGRAVPRLAERWSWEEEGRRLRVQLRKDVFLHDGQRFAGTLAADIVRRTLVQKGNLRRYPSLSNITSVAAEGDHELVIDLSEPSAWLPEDLTAQIEVNPGTGVGTGPYRLVKRTDTTLELERFDRYYLGKPAVKRVTVNSIDTLRTAWTSLLRGDVDMVADLPADAVEFIGNDDIEVVEFERWYQYLIGFNSSRGPFRSPAVRRALNLALDRETLVRRVLQGRGTASTGPLWPKYWAYDASVPGYTYDASQAEALLDAAGFPLPRTSAPGQPPVRFRFTCLIPADFSVWERIALEVQKNLFSVGVEMDFKVVPFEEFNTLMGTGDFDAAINDVISGPTPSRAYMFWRSAKQFHGYNVFGYENPEAEQLFGALKKADNEAAVRSSTRRLQRELLDDPPALFIAWSERARAIRRDFGIPAEPGKDPLLALWRWAPRVPAKIASAP